MPILTGKSSDFLRIAVSAAGRGDRETVREVLARRPGWIGRAGSHGRTMLWEAAYRGRLAMVDWLLDRGADIDACGCHFTPLLVEISPYCAARFKGHDPVADHLLARGAATDIYTAAFLGDGEAVSEYLDREPALAQAERAQHDDGPPATALHCAVSAGHLPVVEMLLERGSDPRPHSGRLIRFALWRERPDILGALLEAGADPARVEAPRGGITHAGLLEVLARHGAPVDVNRAEGGWPPLVFQSRGDRGGSVERVRALLDLGADVDARNYKGQTALHCAARAGFDGIVALLLERGAAADATDDKGQTPLQAAQRSRVKNSKGLAAVVRQLGEAGAGVDGQVAG